MGYYSDVAISMTNKCYEDFLKKIKEYAERNNYTEYENFHMQKFLTNKYYCEQIKTEDGVILIWKDIKWYEIPTYINVYWISSVLNEIKDENKFNYKFIRIGEEYDDIVFDGTNNFEDEEAPWIEISREFVY